MALPVEIVPVTRIAERPGSGKITWSKNGVSGSRIWVTPWFFNDGRSYLEIVQQLLGMTTPGPDYIPAITYPDVFSPDIPYLYCQEVDVEGEDILGTDAWGRAAYRRAILNAKYLPYERGESIHLAAQMFTVKENTHNWVGVPTAMPQRPAVISDDQLTVTFAQLDNAIRKLDQVLAGGPPPGPLVPAEGLTLAQFNALQARRNQLATQRQNLAARLGDNVGAEGVQRLARYLRDLENWQNNQVILFQNPGITDAAYTAANAAASPVTIPVGKVIPLGEYTLERHFVLQPNFGQWISMMGCLNNAYFLGFPPWTLMFSGVDGKRALLPNGSRCWDITLKFLFNPNGHNFIYRAEKGRFEVLVSRETSRERWLSASQLGWQVLPTALHRYLYEPVDYSPFLQYA